MEREIVIILGQRLFDRTESVLKIKIILSFRGGGGIDRQNKKKIYNRLG